jgi:hypothetical protein
MTDIQGSTPGSVKDAGITAVVVLPLPPSGPDRLSRGRRGSEPAAGPAPGALLAAARHGPAGTRCPVVGRHTGKGQPPPWRAGTCCGEHGIMRYESSVTSLSWIPRKRSPGEPGSPSTPDSLTTTTPRPRRSMTSRRCGPRTGSVSPMCCGPGSMLTAPARSAAVGYSGGGHIGDTTIRMGGLRHTFQNALLPDLRRDPERGDGWVRFVQTVGGRTSMPARAGCATRPTSSGRRRWCGPPCRSPCTPTARRNAP